MPSAVKTPTRKRISVAEAVSIVLGAVRPSATTAVPLESCTGEILREDIRADRDFPPFDRVTMDGVALLFADIAAGRTRFPVSGVQAAGAAHTSGGRGACVEVMTGAALPRGLDCVVPVEAIRREGGDVTLLEPEAVKPRQFIHPRASDCPAGSVLITAGTRLDPPAVAVCAAVGKETVLVSRRPRVALVATGNELVPVGGVPAPHEIRISNIYGIRAALVARGFSSVTLFHARDDRDDVRRVLVDAIREHEVIVITGGVSAGAFDYVPAELEAMGTEILFHKVRQRPGLPLLFGVAPAPERAHDTSEHGRSVGEQGVARAVFALPGNPVSATTCAYRYLLPHLAETLGAREPAPELIPLAERFVFEPDLTLFLPVRLELGVDGRPRAIPAPVNTSGDLSRLVTTDGFIELPESGAEFAEGSLWPFYPWGVS